MVRESKPTTSKDKVARFEEIDSLFAAAYADIQVLARKKPTDTLNETQVKILNRLLIVAQEVLKDETSGKYLDLLSDEKLPKYCDVTLILSQFDAALKKFKSDFHTWSDGWSTK